MIDSVGDSIEGVRHSIHAGAELPGSALPKTLHEIDVGSLGVIGSVVGTSAVRLALGFTRPVENAACGLIDPAKGAKLPLVFPVADNEIGSATTVVTVDPNAEFESAGSGTDARSGWSKQGGMGEAPVADLTAACEAVFPSVP